MPASFQVVAQLSRQGRVAFLPGHRAVRKCPKPKAPPREARTLGEHLRAKRLEEGRTQKELAQHLAVDEFTVANWEAGHTVPLAHRYARIAHYLGYDPIPTGDAIPQRIKAYRRREGLTQAQAARRLGVNAKTWWEWENGKRLPTQINAVRIKRLLDARAQHKPPGEDRLGERLRWWRIQAGLSQPQLANRLGVHATTLRTWELERRQPSASKIGGVLGLLDQAFAGEE